MTDLLLITPPFTQLNTPYPGTAYLKGFLNTKSISSYQMDLGIEVIWALFSKDGLSSIFEYAEPNIRRVSENAQRMFALRQVYIRQIDGIIAFLQGKNDTFARQICMDGFLPQGARFEQVDDLEWPFGKMGLQDKAKHLSTLMLEDLADFVKECVDVRFGFSRYAERLGMSANSFDELQSELDDAPSYVDRISWEILRETLVEQRPKLICFSIPFPGNLYSGLRMAKHIKTEAEELGIPTPKIAMGGGFANTELRSVSDSQVFDFFDYICLDDGELPIEQLCKKVLQASETVQLKRTFYRQNGEVLYENAALPDYQQNEVGTPDYSDLQLDRYISVIEVTNPMHSLWSDGRWLKLTMAHGCYWGKCTFCDISLDYIKRYEPVAAHLLVDRMEELMEKTGERGFHFVDEAAPPALMKAVALEILKRGLLLSWWTNIRFEKAFSKDLCQLLKASGCIAVSGGLEVASERLLKLIDKGVTVPQVARVCQNLHEAGIMAHAYLMYGYPTQTEQETVDSLEMVRQLFEAGVVKSGFWHRFALTAHSPVGMDPDAFGVIPQQAEITFAENDVAFEDKTGVDHEKFSFGLKKSLLNYMNEIGFDYPLQFWFEAEIPRTSIAENFIDDCLNEEESESLPKSRARLLWLGSDPVLVEEGRKKNKRLVLQIETTEQSLGFPFEKEKAKWLAAQLELAKADAEEPFYFKDFEESYTEHFSNLKAFWNSEEMQALRQFGFLAV